ncbi:MAG: hypothetical protein GQ582_13540 [Methyloprofundus sp.]|nr:hypothetical protein [Methyloprofundus sp.]
MRVLKNLTMVSSSALIALNSGVAIAAEDSLTDYVPAIWPFFVLIGLIFVFKDFLNCVPPIDLSESEPEPEPKLETKTKTQPEPSDKPKQEEVVAESPAATEDDLIDLRDNSGQCQASTAKGTRCKRKNTLSDATLTINNKEYLITACAQHHNDALKPYPGLLE